MESNWRTNSSLNGISYDWLIQQFFGRQIKMAAHVDEPLLPANLFVTDIRIGAGALAYGVSGSGYATNFFQIGVPAPGTPFPYGLNVFPDH